MDLLSSLQTLASVLFLLSFIWSAHLLFFKNRSAPREPPCTGPKSYPLVGNLPHFINNCDRFLEWSTELLAASPTATVTVAEGERFFRAFHVAAHLSVERAKLPHPLLWKIKRWLGSGDEKRLRESTAVVNEFVDKYVRLKRLCGSTSGGDLLSRFSEDGTHSDEFLRDFLLSIVLAGSDTTPAAITWFFWVLSSRPDVVDRIRAELRSVQARRDEPGEEAFTLEELWEMSYLHAAIAESLRLHPAVLLLPRLCAEYDEMPDGTRVRRGWTVMYNSYAMGRSEVIWGKDWDEYKPERWLKAGESQARRAFQYPVFHAGPRMCLGRHELSISMRMEGGLPLRFCERRDL